jgi:hypothetical protein
MAQQRDPAVVVRVLSPDLLAGQLHGTESDPTDGQVSANLIIPCRQTLSETCQLLSASR